MALTVKQQASYWGIGMVVFLLALWGLGNVILPFVAGMAIAHFMDRDIIIQYFKPLPYRFQFKPLDEEGVVLLYVD